MLDLLKRTADSPKEELKSIFERARTTVELLITDMIPPPGFSKEKWFPKNSSLNATILILTRLQ